jgi:hypothetical protein
LDEEVFLKNVSLLSLAGIFIATQILRSYVSAGDSEFLNQVLHAEKLAQSYMDHGQFSQAIE